MFGHDRNDALGGIRIRQPIEFDQHQANEVATTANDQFTEIAILGDEYASLPLCQKKYILVASGGRSFDNRNDIVTCEAQPRNYRGGNIFIREQAQASLRCKNSLVLHIVSSEGESRSNVVFRNIGMGLQEVRLRMPSGQFSQHMFDRDPRTPDARLAHHHSRVGYDTLMLRHKSLPFNRSTLT